MEGPESEEMCVSYFTLAGLSKKCMGLPARPLPSRLLFSALFAAALTQPTNEPSDDERG